MNTITNVSLTNVKGTSRKLSLAPITLITGPNGSGKSAIIEAIQANLIGYVPAWGKQHATTFAMSSGRAMTIGITFADGTRRVAEWAAQPGGGVKAKVEPPMLSDTAVDLTGFYKLTARERTALLFRQFAPEDIMGKYVTAMREGPGAEGLPPAVLAEVGKLAAGDGGHEAINAAIATFTEKQKGNKAIADSARAAAQAAAEAGPEMGEAANIMTEAQAQGVLANRSRMAGEVSALERELALLKSRRQTLVNRQVELNRRAVEHIAPPDPAAVAQAEGAANEALARYNKLLHEVAALEAASDQLAEEVDQCQNMMANLIELDEEQLAVCPTCLQPSNKSHRLAAFSDKLDGLQKEAVAALNRLAAGNTQLEAAYQAHKAAVEVDSNLRRQAMKAEASAKAYAQLEADTAAVEKELAGLPDSRIAGTEAKLVEAQAALAVAESQALEATKALANAQSLNRMARESEALIKRIEDHELLAAGFGVLVAASRAFMEAAVNTAAGRLLFIAQHLWSACGCRGELVWDVDSIALKVGSTLVPTHAMSGREQLLARIGLQAMLATGAAKGLVLIDEVGRLDTLTLAALVGAFNRLIPAYLSQVIMAGAIEPDESLAGEYGEKLKLITTDN